MGRQTLATITKGEYGKGVGLEHVRGLAVGITAGCTIPKGTRLALLERETGAKADGGRDRVLRGASLCPGNKEAAVWHNEVGAAGT